MTDATHAVTQSALEAFAREYLTGLGASISEEGTRWHVRLPTHVDVAFSDDREFDVVLADETEIRHEKARILAPDSELAQQLLEEAAEMAVVGQVAITQDLIDAEYQYPPWLTESRVTVDNASFSPYYDRTAVCAFVRVSVETVSEYQTQFLQAVAVDVESKQQLPDIPELLIDRFYTPKTTPPQTGTEATEEGTVQPSPDTVAGAITTAQDTAVENVDDGIAEVRQSASRAADAEFEEYRQLQEQRLQNLQDELDSISDRLQDVATEVDGAAPQQRVEVLQKRKELQNEKEDLETQLEEILQEKESGYAGKRDEIYERHAIDVHTTPLAVTLVRYERGEIKFDVRADGCTDTIRAPYALGAGVTDEVRCDHCQKPLSDTNPVRINPSGVGCRSCQ